MDTTHSPPVIILSPDSKRNCIRIKARIKIQGEQEFSEPAVEIRPHPPYQAYCETVSSSRPQSPDVFTTPPTHSEPFQSAQVCDRPTYTARTTIRRATVSSVSTIAQGKACPEHVIAPTPLPASTKICDQDVPAFQTPSQGGTALANRYHTVSRLATPRDSYSGGVAHPASRNHTRSLSQVQQANISLGPTAQIITSRTPLRQKRYGRMNYHPLPPLPPSPPDPPLYAASGKQDLAKETVNFSRGELKKKPAQQNGQVNVPHPSCGNPHGPLPVLSTISHYDVNLTSATAGHERPQSKASRRTVTFADDSTQSSRSSSPDHHVHNRTLRQSKSFSFEPQIQSSLRLHRSHDSLLAASITSKNDTASRLHASRRTAPKDFKHPYVFGQRPASRMAPPPGLGRTSNANYNPRLSTSKAQYRGLATLPRPLPSSLRVVEPQIGPRHPPWGSLNNLEERRERRVDARERDQVKRFRAATLSEATTLGSTDSFGRERMKKEVEEYKEQVMSVYPDMAFDGNAGKGGRSCFCAVM
ncbi:hypothetical protein SVAN01_00815 [Stagonosporopsis vannaccii]|nr:hypothetical protein SVAN01_00815 [Stagonosporopsis vannaccii]